MRFISISALIFCSIIAASSAFAASNTTIFPPVKWGTDQWPATGDPECAITYEAGKSSTICRTGQQVMKLALPDCAVGQVVTYTASGFECSTAPAITLSCPTGKVLTGIDNNNPVCTDMTAGGASCQTPNGEMLNGQTWYEEAPCFNGFTQAYVWQCLNGNAIQGGPVTTGGQCNTN
ncbi:hypothetical protein [Methylosinus sp. Sm6]|uniref:hypothetical protein n=1 Tax=Methylosinus sp. Sm6 TaxID=2866948 RepID=UPI001C99F753|nr:hypothetical protein [Methylosinus sp. Sm6]MBY6240037.1 hypothetical protein [Methylosinus sp. Sm6]